jgi:predicted  nucleic acid-binding Zn-ribbon protein|tara:strand:- start:248 stop:553 length:306 start_codon:yes stop_codon:yes gene_type:complete
MPKNKKEPFEWKDVISDLDIEISNLRKEKQDINKQLKKTGSNIIGTQTEESELRKTIEKLIVNEGVLQKKRNKLIEKLDSTEEKMSKVKHIKEELTDAEGE